MCIRDRGCSASERSIINFASKSPAGSRVRLDVAEGKTDNGRIVVVDHVGKMRLQIGKQLVGLAKRAGSGTHGVPF